MNRKRLARLVLVLAVVVVAGQLLSALPREVHIRYHLGPDHARVTEARIAYMQDGHEMKGVRFRYAEGEAPPAVRHEVELAPGTYRIVADVRGPGLHRSVRRALEVPAEGLVRIDLFDHALALGLPDPDPTALRRGGAPP